MNTFFINIAHDLLSQEFPKIASPVTPDAPHFDYIQKIVTPDDTCEIPPIDAEKLSYIIRKLPNKASSGIDLLSTPILKLLILSPYFFICLLKILNLCIKNTTFPERMKISRIVPIPKTGDPSKLQNLRGISVIPMLSKILEKHISLCIIDFLEAHNLFHPNQSGFRTGISTTHAVVKFSNHIYNAIDKKLLSCAVLIDLSKAFDTVDHQLLLSKLPHYGFSRNLIQLLESFLHERQQLCSLNNQTSKAEKLFPLGVPQGSVLGPLLFLLAVNDLLHLPLKSTLDMYADDITLYFSSASIEELSQTINADLRRICTWFRDNRLVINNDKTKALLFGSEHKLRTNSTDSIPLFLDHKRIEFVKSAKLLGVVLDGSLSWKDHVSRVIGKISSNLYPLVVANRLRLPTHIRKILFHALISPHLNYGIPLYSGCSSQQYLHRLRILTKKAIRLVAGVRFPAHTSTIFRSLKILTFDQLIQLRLAKLIHSILHLQAPVYLHSAIPPRLNRFSSRYPTMIQQPHYLTAHGQRNPIFRGIQVFNSDAVIPLHTITNTRNFSAILKSKLICPTVNST